MRYAIRWKKGYRSMSGGSISEDDRTLSMRVREAAKSTPARGRQGIAAHYVVLFLQPIDISCSRGLLQPKLRNATPDNLVTKMPASAVVEPWG